MSNKSRGLYRKYHDIKRIDGTHLRGHKHFGCEYFVLDLTHDKHALAAIRAYATSCKDEYPALSRDLEEIERHYANYANMADAR